MNDIGIKADSHLCPPHQWPTARLLILVEVPSLEDTT